MRDEEKITGWLSQRDQMAKALLLSAAAFAAVEMKCWRNANPGRAAELDRQGKKMETHVLLEPEAMQIEVAVTCDGERVVYTVHRQPPAEHGGRVRKET